MSETDLIPSDFNQTQVRGTNEQEYEIYAACAESLGWEVKTFEEWMCGQ